VQVAASDAGGVAELRYAVDGLAASGTQTIAPPLLVAAGACSFRSPSASSPPAQIRLRAGRDRGESESAPVPIVVSDADTSAPETIVIAASAPAGALTTVTCR
jgi:hypothetical protein